MSLPDELSQQGSHEGLEATAWSSLWSDAALLYRRELAPDPSEVGWREDQTNSTVGGAFPGAW